MTNTNASDHRLFMQEALAEARRGFQEGGIPIGSVLVVDGQVLGRGHNRRVQQANPVLHGEMDALQAAGRLPAEIYRRSVLYTTLSPCAMCSGAIVLYEIPTVVIAENHSFLGEEAWLKSRGVELVHLDLSEAKDLMAEFMARSPTLWNEDIGEV